MFGMGHEPAMRRDGDSSESGVQIAVLVSNYRRPRHLEMALTSIGAQRDVVNRMEVVVTDDGSDDDSVEVVARFAAQVPFAVKMTTHAHDAFQLARCRNDGVMVSEAPYILFCDGDCVLPPRHVHYHLRRRRPRVVVAGDCCRLSREVSRAVDARAVTDGAFTQWASAQERRRLAQQYWRSLFYNLVRHPHKPKLVGNNVGVWRDDYVAINGYDEQFVGWGCEDDDLGWRLRRTGVRVRSIVNWTCVYHLWHPVEATCPDRWRDGPNVAYFRASGQRDPRCQRGLEHLDSPPELRKTEMGDQGARVVRRRPFAELVFCPGIGQFSGRATWNVLVVNDAHVVPTLQASAADLIVTPVEARHLLDRLARWERNRAADDRQATRRRAA